MQLYSVSQFAEKLGVRVSTLRTWDKEGKLVALYANQQTKVHGRNVIPGLGCAAFCGHTLRVENLQGQEVNEYGKGGVG